MDVDDLLAWTEELLNDYLETPAEERLELPEFIERYPDPGERPRMLT